MKRRVVIMSIALCWALGAPMGTLVLGLLQGDRSMLFRADIAGVPFLAYAFIFAFPVSIAAGLVASALLLFLLRTNPRQTLPLWIVECSASGAVLGAGLGLVLARLSSEVHPLVPVSLVALPGSVCGALLGLYGWYEGGRLKTSAPN
jgi:hypothetical protein